jgi:hypothetical protein
LNNLFGNLSIRGLRGYIFYRQINPYPIFFKYQVAPNKKREKKGTRSKRFKKQKNKALII